ncbi:GDP-L-fucose synthase [Arenicella chitinivorans]|uniref:GDP-L-fucose synthase n=1 Tax=Arenicella chitinivorans TaxID=1329800 RepID=A0A918VMB7_9GAMM|nr:GDP-L-fucose synthase [Arenicella chitinivorans]GHA07496.1 GDP-L-fucose synthase [Arenicella chitinivorans]
MTKRVYVAGHKGMVGSALVRNLTTQPDVEIISRTRSEVDLTDQSAVRSFFSKEKIDHVYHAAAKVGGIYANNTYPADFIYENLMVECNVLQAAFEAGVEKLVLLGSSCIYPKFAPQPIPESALLTSELEPTNEPYAIAKIAGIKLCESYNRQHGVDYRSVMPTNLYGPNDNFHPMNSHVIPAMMLRFHKAKLDDARQVVVWGSGKPMREFLHVDDMAAATLFVMGLSRSAYQQATEERLSHLNIGTGEDCTIRELAYTMAEVVGFEGEIVFDSSKPDGTPRKLLDVSKINSLGWQASYSLVEGLSHTYGWLSKNEQILREA